MAIKTRLGGRRSQPNVTQIAGATQTRSSRFVSTGNYQTMTDAQASSLRDMFDSQYDASTTAGIKMYIAYKGPMGNFDGQSHSLSQVMNYMLDQGVDLNTLTPNMAKQMGVNLDVNKIASMQYTDAYMTKAMHAIGSDTLLTRGAHDDMLKNVFKISDYSQYSESQLQKMLVGKAVKSTAHWSTSYDNTKNPFLSSGSGVSGGREVIYKIKAGANTKVVFGNKAQSEIIISKGTNYRINSVKYTGSTATPLGKGSKKQIEIELEVF